MTNETQKPSTPVNKPAANPQQQNQSDPKPSTDKPGSQPQQK
jgi:hypothetical protein